MNWWLTLDPGAHRAINTVIATAALAIAVAGAAMTVWLLTGAIRRLRAVALAADRRACQAMDQATDAMSAAAAAEEIARQALEEAETARAELAELTLTINRKDPK